MSINFVTSGPAQTGVPFSVFTNDRRDDNENREHCDCAQGSAAGSNESKTIVCNAP